MLSLADFSARTDDFVQLLTRLVEIESPSTDKAAVDRLGLFIQQGLAALGAAVIVDDQVKAGNHVIGRWNAVSDLSGILVLCHMDTVYDLGTLARRPVRIEDGRLFGPGAQDMKAGIANLLLALRLLRERGRFPQRPVTALFTSDEETGSETSRALIERLAARAEVVLCLEPALADGALKTARKGTGDMEIVARGRAAHAGVDHEKGRNAIEELAHHILAVQQLTDYSIGTTLSVGRVSGGTRSNVIPDEACAVVDLRIAVPDELDRLQQWARARRPVLDGAQVTITVKADRPPMPRDAVMAATFQKVQAIGSRLGLSLAEGSTGGGSDANFVAPLGVPVMDGLGAVGDGGHSEREFVTIASLPERAALLAAILTEW